MGVQKNTVKFNVGGRNFETTATTLGNAGRNSLFGPMFDENWNLQSDPATENFMDRNPECFAVLLDLLRTGELHIPSNVPEKLVYSEALFYGLLDHVRTAKWGPIDGNRLHLGRSIVGRAPGDGTAIRAGPDGGFCVAHGCMVHVYDWMLEEHPPINLDYQRVNDAIWVNPKSIVISACERLGRDDEGMGLFNALSGELTFKYRVEHENQVKSYTGGALCTDSNLRLFSSCKGRSNEYGIGVWDQVTGKQIDFFYERSGCPLGDADKLQWLHGTNCLFVSTTFPRKDHCYISLLDFRAKQVVGGWCDAGDRSDGVPRVRDAIAMEETNSICVVNEYEDLGFLDLRGWERNIRWSSMSRHMHCAMLEESRYPKLLLHGGQLFSSMNDSISVFCGPEWVMTSRLKNSWGGSICDFSIGGDRLFALRSEECVFDIWETKPPPII